jgi:hypothetical protein
MATKDYPLPKMVVVTPEGNTRELQCSVFRDTVPNGEWRYGYEIVDLKYAAMPSGIRITGLESMDAAIGAAVRRVARVTDDGIPVDFWIDLPKEAWPSAQDPD